MRAVSRRRDVGEARLRGDMDLCTRARAATIMRQQARTARESPPELDYIFLGARGGGLWRARAQQQRSSTAAVASMRGRAGGGCISRGSSLGVPPDSTGYELLGWRGKVCQTKKCD